jgi:drug/metabolite transporter (DMT)-like permease
MILWIWLAIGAQIIYALVAILDKYIVTSKTVLHPFSYAFYVSILSSLSVLVFLGSSIPLPYGIETPKFSDLTIPNGPVILLCLFSGILMFIALVNLYEGLSKADASDVVPVVSSVGAIGTLILEYLFLGGEYNTINLSGIGLLILGTFLVSRLRFNGEVLFHTIISGISFAAYYALIKYIFELINFDSGFLYTRIGLVIAALLVIIIPSYRKRIFRKLKNREVKKTKASAYVLGIKAVAGLASIMTLKAIQLGSVAVIQAMSGVQFLVLILFSICFGWMTPTSFGENEAKFSVFMHKILAVIVITLGLFFSFI